MNPPVTLQYEDLNAVQQQAYNQHHYEMVFIRKFF
jgi:hypothetical protein